MDFCLHNVLGKKMQDYFSCVDVAVIIREGRFRVVVEGIFFMGY